jgi:phosphatidylglycerol lysyltransferase
MTTWSGNQWYLEADRPGYVSYQSHAGVGIALGDPIASDAAARRAMTAAFVDFAQVRGLLPCLFSAGAETAAWARGRNWRAVEVAVEAVIDLPDLQFKGKAWQDVRSALNRAAKEGVTLELGTLRDMPVNRLAQVRSISEQWVGDKGLPEMGFTLGGVDEALDPAVRPCCRWRGHRARGDLLAAGLRPRGAVKGWTLDVMRRLPDGFRPVMEFLIASACVAFRDKSARVVSLSGAPLTGDATANPAGNAVDALLAWLGEQLEPLYGFRSLDRFKAKFFPRHEPLYLLYPDEAALPRIGVALTRAYLPNASLVDLASAGLRART